MITYRNGDILKDESEALVNTVNCVGVMGRGLALQFKVSYPGNFKEYAIACKRGGVRPGEMLVYETNELTGPRYIINFPTKRHWREKSHIEDIKTGLKALTEVLHHRQIHSVAIPPLGSGLGGLNWADVRPLIEVAMSALPHVHVTVYEPEGAPSTEANEP